MSEVELSRRIGQPDDLYDRLIALHAGLSDEDSMIVNARLIMILANHIGDERILTEAIRLARGSR